MQAFFDFVTHDWYFAIPMFGMSIVSITLVIWRIMLNLHARTDLNTFLPAFQERLQRDGVEGALQYCRSLPGEVPRRLYAAGLETSRQGMAAMRRSMASVIELEILPDLNFLLPSILAIAKIATMVGLLGTVISMIGTFTAIAEMKSKGEDVSSASGAIGLALFATALGLVTAIPLVFAHVLFKAWIANFEIGLRSAAQKLVLIMQSTKPAAAPAGTKASGVTEKVVR